MDKESQFTRWFNKIMAQPYGEGSCSRFSNICLTGNIEFGKDNQKFFHVTINACCYGYPDKCFLF